MPTAGGTNQKCRKDFIEAITNIGKISGQRNGHPGYARNLGKPRRCKRTRIILEPSGPCWSVGPRPSRGEEKTQETRPGPHFIQQLGFQKEAIVEKREGCTGLPLASKKSKKYDCTACHSGKYCFMRLEVYM